MWLGKRTRRANADAIAKQIANAKQIAVLQLDQLRQNNERDFNKTVLSGNRQLWITDLRIVASKILTCIHHYIRLQRVDNEIIEDFNLHLMKAELMLNRAEHSKLIAALGELPDLCYQIQIGNKEIDELEPVTAQLKEHFITALQAEWTKVRQGI